MAVKIDEVVELAMRVVLITLIDRFLSTFDYSTLYFDYSTLYSLSKDLTGLGLLVSLLLIATHGDLLFTYGFFISLYIIIVLAFFTIGANFPAFQDLILTMSRRQVFLDALILYQGLLFAVGIDNSLISNLRPLFFLAVLAIINGAHWGFMLAFWYFMACEFFGVHKNLKRSFHEASYWANNLGYLRMFIYYYCKRKITLALKLFWLILLIAAMIYFFEPSARLDINWFLICTIAASNTNLQLFAMSLWLPEISYAILWTARALLIWSMSHTADDLEPRDMGKALEKAVVFYFIACVINSALNVDNSNVLQQIYFIAVMLFVAYLHILKSVFKLCDTTLMDLSTSLQHNFLTHIRAMALTMSLILVLPYTNWIFCSLFSFRLVSLLVFPLTIVIVFQATRNLAIYALFVYDLKSLNTFEQLDDWVYYLNAVSNSLELAHSFLVLSFGVWVCYYDSWSIMGVMVVVGLTNYVWLTARNGWKVFLDRRAAVARTSHLADATPEQLKDRQDLCAICFHSMSNAKITQCGHFFHSNCLRKWLYIQPSCPLCHQDVIISSS